MKKTNFKIDEIMLVLIVAFIAIIISAYNKANDHKGTEAEKITQMILDDSHVSFASNGVIDIIKLEEVRNMAYEDFKKSVNAKSDFCVYVEDENGNLLLAKGPSKLGGDGIFCRE